MRSKIISTKNIVLGIALLSFILLSPKWLIPFAAWVGPACLLYYIRHTPFKRGIFIAWLMMSMMTAISFYDVIPVPIFILPLFALLNGFITILPYLLDRLLHHKTGLIISTLILPSAKVVQEWLESFGGRGTWTSIAYTQSGSDALMQLTSVTGIWGITFLVYWFASIAVQLASHHWKLQKIHWIYAGILAAVFLFGQIRLIASFHSKTNTVKIAGISVGHTSFMEQLYQDFSGQEIDLPISVSPASVELQKVNEAFLSFFENPHDQLFKTSRNKLQELQDTLFIRTEEAIIAGAKIITWSEANAMVLRQNEQELVNRGKALASKHAVYLLMSVGVIFPGPIVQDRVLIENKTILLAPDGTINTVFHKNKPVPGELSKPGDGTVPVIATQYGRIAISICYDADFPDLMAQAGRQKADILLLPSADWKAIDPYHSSMAVIRGIENGCALVRPGRGGTSIMSDPFGRIITSAHFFAKGEAIIIGEIPINHRDTIYSYTTNLLPWLSLILIITLSFIIVRRPRIKTAKQ